MSPDSDAEAGARKLYASLVQDQGPKPTTRHHNKSFSKNYYDNACLATHVASSALPQTRFRHQLPASSGASSFSLPMVECALAAAATLGGLGLGGGVDVGMGAPTSPILGSAASPTQYGAAELLQEPLNPKDRAASTATMAVSPGAAAGNAAPTGPRTSGSVAGRRIIDDFS